MTDPTALQTLCSVPAEVFACDVWARTAWLSRAEDLPGTACFSVAAVDELLSRRGLRTPFIRLAKDGKVLPTTRFTGSGGVGARIADQVRDDDVLRLFADGTTVVLQGVHRTWSPVGELAADLSDELGHPVQVNAYITPPQSQGFAAHYDTHDVFVLQVSGRKRWRIHEPVFESPLAENPWEKVADQVQARASEPPVIDEILAPGDCLYLPRGFIHSAEALGGTSVHLTFGIHPVVQKDVARAAMRVLEQGGWQSSMPARWDPTSPAGTAEIESVVKDMLGALAELDIDAVAAVLHDERARLQRPQPISPIAQAEAAARLAPTDRIRLRAHLGARIEPGALILPDGRRIPIPDAVLDRLMAGDVISAADLPLALGPELLVKGIVTLA